MLKITKSDIINECAHNLDKTDNCMDDTTFNKLKVIIKKENLVTKKDAIQSLQTIFDCTSESCLFTKSVVIDILGDDGARKQLSSRFKPNGPLDKAKWLSDKDIDDTLRQFAKKCTNSNFKHIEYQMRDFEKTGSALSTIDFANEYKSGVRCFGVVLNDDFSTGGGTHWTALFGDFRNKLFTLEHFNSSGNGPKNEVLVWMNATKMHIEKTLDVSVKIVIVSDTKHQTDNSSCGPYSLYYIISRLDNIPINVFQGKRIPDSLMWEFRKVLFRK
jgi:hypothetical protein